MRFLAAASIVLTGAICAGCGGDDDTSTTASVDVAAVGDAPTVPPARVAGEERVPPQPTVIAAGTTAQDEPFELVVYGTDGRGPCLQMMFPAGGGEGGGACGETLFREPSHPIESFGSSTGHGHLVEAWIAPDVESVELREGDEGGAIPGTTEQIAPALLRKIDGPDGLGIFVAFLPEGVEPADVTATALDADGQPLGTASWPDVSG